MAWNVGGGYTGPSGLSVGSQLGYGAGYSAYGGYGVPTGSSTGSPTGGYSGAWGNLGGIPTAKGNLMPGIVPYYFMNQPQGQMTLSPLAQACLAKMFPEFLWGGAGTAQYTSAANTEANKGMTMLPSGEEVPVAPTTSTTEAIKPKTPSAQLYRQMEKAGVIPTFRSYIEDILGIPWEPYAATLSAAWPSAKKGTKVGWQTTRQL